MAPHRAEARAVRVMKDLYFWAETVVRAYESEDLEHDAELGEDSQSGWSNVEVGDAVVVAKTARNLCEWLKDRTARELCDDVVGHLEHLEEGENGGLWEVEGEFGAGIL